LADIILVINSIIFRPSPVEDVKIIGL